MKTETKNKRPSGVLTISMIVLELVRNNFVALDKINKSELADKVIAVLRDLHPCCITSDISVKDTIEVFFEGTGYVDGEPVGDKFNFEAVTVEDFNGPMALGYAQIFGHVGILQKVLDTMLSELTDELKLTKPADCTIPTTTIPILSLGESKTTDKVLVYLTGLNRMRALLTYGRTIKNVLGYENGRFLIKQKFLPEKDPSCDMSLYTLPDEYKFLNRGKFNLI